MTSLGSNLRWIAFTGVLVLIGAFAITRAAPLAATQSGGTGVTKPPEAGASPSPAPSVEAVSATPSGCRVLPVMFDQAPPQVELGGASGVVRATVVDIDQTIQWPTPDGAMPTGDRFLSTLLSGYRTAHVKVTAVRSGQAEAGQVVAIRIQGGTFSGALNGNPAGCSTIVIDGQAEMTPGADVVLLLGTVPALGKVPPSTVDVVDAWPVTDGNVHESDGSVVPAANLLLGLAG